MEANLYLKIEAQIEIKPEGNAEATTKAKVFEIKNEVTIEERKGIRKITEDFKYAFDNFIVENRKFKKRIRVTLYLNSESCDGCIGSFDKVSWIMEDDHIVYIDNGGFTEYPFEKNSFEYMIFEVV